MGRTNKILYGQDTPGLEKDSGNALLSHFGFNIKGIKGKRGPKFPVNNEGRTYKTVNPRKPIKMTSNEVISEAVVVLMYKYYGEYWNTKIVEEVPCKYD